jgi:PQQ-like domain
MRKGIALGAAGLALAAGVGLAVSRAADQHRPSPVLWAERYNGPGHRGDEASAVAVSPDGKTVIVTGLSTAASGKKEYATIAYSAASGARLWVGRYGGPGGAQASASAVAVSALGGRAFVTGRAPGPGTGEPDYFATAAYDLKDGRQLWVTSYGAGPSYLVQHSAVLAVAPDGRTVFVSGPTSAGYVTIAYHAATGVQLWARLDKPAGRFGSFYAASALSVSPDDRTVLAAWAGQGAPAAGSPAVTTVAYSAATGTRLWERASREPMMGEESVPAIVVSPRGGVVFVSGTGSSGRASPYGYVTAAYDIATGSQLWARTFAPSHTSSSLSALAVSPSGAMVYVTGSSDDLWGARAEYATTVAYRAATGNQAWVRRHRGAEPISIAVGRSGRVYVTGGASYAAYTTVAYSAAGAELWARLYRGRGQEASATSLAVSPVTGAVYVTGYLGTDYKKNFDYLTIAYDG